MPLKISCVEFRDGVEHCYDVLRRDVGGDVVYLLEDEPAAGRENFHSLEHVRPDLFGRSERKDGLRIASAAPEA